MKRTELRNRDDIWNAVVHVVSHSDYPTEDVLLNEAFIIFQYYAELESGGHESLFNWYSSDIKETGISQYLKKLTTGLEKIGAQEYASIEKKYGEEMWNLYGALEDGDIEEDEFYHVIEKADHEYYNLDGKIEELLAEYFVDIHTDLIEIAEE